MKQISMVMTVALALTLLAATPKAGTLKHTQVTTETSASQPSLLETSSCLRAVEFTSLPQAIRKPSEGGNALITCKGRKDCGDLRKSGKCKAGTLKTGVAPSNGKYYGDCVAK
jgi:hypothetical protein